MTPFRQILFVVTGVKERLSYVCITYDLFFNMHFLFSNRLWFESHCYFRVIYGSNRILKSDLASIRGITLVTSSQNRKHNLCRDFLFQSRNRTMLASKNTPASCSFQTPTLKYRHQSKVFLMKGVNSIVSLSLLLYPVFADSLLQFLSSFSNITLEC